MSIFAANLKFLRRHSGLSQDILALALDLKRTTLSAYENGQSEPNLDLLCRIAAHFHLSLDTLLHTDLTTLAPDELADTLRGEAPDTAGRHLRILATSVAPDGSENVEVVPAAARAGYTAGYADPQYIATLPHMSLPFLSSQRKYRAFPVEGDSMPPISKGSYVVGQYVADWHTLHKGQFAVVITRNEGIVFKKLYPDFAAGVLTLVSTNPLYEPYDIDLADVLEIWAFAAYVAREVLEPGMDNGQIEEILFQLRRDVAALKKKNGL